MEIENKPRAPQYRRTAPRRTLLPVSEVWEWQLQGACREADPNLFFPPEGERGPARRSREAAARAVCVVCPVVEKCRAQALRFREPYGVWGGLTESDREEIFARERAQKRKARKQTSTRPPGERPTS